MLPALPNGPGERKPARFPSVFRLILRSSNGLFWPVVVLVTALLPALPQATAYAQASAGYSEYYLPGATQQVWDIFSNLDNDPDLVEAQGMHVVIATTASLDGTTIYYDHWEDGYDFDPANPGATADEIYILDTGDVQEFESSNVPVSLRGSATFYDGRDRLFAAGGLVTVTLAT